MENYVKQLLKDADLTVVTKKHVRMKYKEHVGRELSQEEKTKINDMVYEFVKELSAAVQQNTSSTDTQVTTPKSKDESPGNKENKQSNQKTSTFIIKGKVVDRNDLYKSKSKEKKKASPDDKQKVEAEKKRKEGANKDNAEKVVPSKQAAAEKVVPSKQQAAAAKLRINEVMSAVFGPDKDESSSEVSSVSSLTDTSLSEVEEEETMEHINEALQKLKAARDKKIQMSLEKKTVNKKQENGNKKSSAKRSLAMNNLKTKYQDDGESSEAISVLSVNSENSQENLTDNETTKKKKIKTSARHVFNTDSESSDVKLKRTPKRYDKRKVCSSKRLDVVSEKKKRLVKRKGRKVVEESGSNSDIEAKEVSVNDKHEKSTSTGKRDVHGFDIDSDSENETLDKIKKTLKHVSGESVLDKRKNIAFKNNEEKVKKYMYEKEFVFDTDSDLDNGSFSVRKQSKKDKGKFIKKDYCDERARMKDSKSSTNAKDLEKGKFSKSSESSSGDTPLAQLKRNKKTLSKSVEVEETKSKIKKSLEHDSDRNLKETASVQERKQFSDRSLDLKSNGECNPESHISETSVENSQDVVKEKEDALKASVLKQQENLDHENTLGAKRKRKLSEKSNVSEEGNPDIKKGKRQKLDSISSEENDSEFSDVSTGDTPLVKKKFNLRKSKTNMSSDHSAAKDTEAKMSGRKMKLRGKQDSDTVKVRDNIQSSEDEANCDNKTDSDSLSPIKKVKGHRKTVSRLDSSSDEESQNKKPSRKKISTKKKLHGESKVNGTSSQSEQTSQQASSDSDADSDDSDDVPLAQFSKQPLKTKVSDLSSDSEDDIPLSKTKAAQNKQTESKTANKKEPAGPASEVAYVRLLRQICRECQMFVRNDRELAGCNTDREKIEKMEQMLRDVGMKGKPTLKKAEEVKLMKEAKELSADNIISSETGRVMRKVKSIWARRTISPVKPVKPKGKDPFSGLKDIIDSEGTESD